MRTPQEPDTSSDPAGIFGEYVAVQGVRADDGEAGEEQGEETADEEEEEEEDDEEDDTHSATEDETDSNCPWASKNDDSDDDLDLDEVPGDEMRAEEEGADYAAAWWREVAAPASEDGNNDDVAEDVDEDHSDDDLDDDSDEVEDPTLCKKCGSGDHAPFLLLCDGEGCVVGYHTYCIGLAGVPDGDWFCPTCYEDSQWDVLPCKPSTRPPLKRLIRAGCAEHVGNLVDGLQLLAVSAAVEDEQVLLDATQPRAASSLDTPADVQPMAASAVVDDEQMLIDATQPCAASSSYTPAGLQPMAVSAGVEDEQVLLIGDTQPRADSSSDIPTATVPRRRRGHRHVNVDKIWQQLVLFRPNMIRYKCTLSKKISKDGSPRTQSSATRRRSRTIVV